MEPLFGARWWRLAAFAIPLSVPLPVLFLWRQVAFDPAHFIEIWVQLLCTTYIVMFIVEFAQERSATRDVALALCDLFRTMILPSLTAASEALESLAVVGRTPTVESVESMRATLRELEALRLPMTMAQQLSTHTPFQMTITLATADFNVAGWIAALAEMVDEEKWYDVDLEETTRIASRLKSGRTAMEAAILLLERV